MTQKSQAIQRHPWDWTLTDLYGKDRVAIIKIRINKMRRTCAPLALCRLTNLGVTAKRLLDAAWRGSVSLIGAQLPMSTSETHSEITGHKVHHWVQLRNRCCLCSRDYRDGEVGRWESWLEVRSQYECIQQRIQSEVKSSFMALATRRLLWMYSVNTTLSTSRNHQTQSHLRNHNHQTPQSYTETRNHCTTLQPDTITAQHHHP